MQLKSIYIIVLCLLHLATQAQQLHQNARMKKIIDFDQQHYFAQNQKGNGAFVWQVVELLLQCNTILYWH